MVAANPGTAKVEEAYRQGSVHVVYPAWLNRSLCRWEKEDEQAFRVPRNEKLAALPAEALRELARGPAAQNEDAAHDDLADMDWGEAEDEVDAFLGDDDETESELDSAAQSMYSEADSLEAVPVAVTSPLSRRREAARPGPSKLRHTQLAGDADDAESSENGSESGSDSPSAPAKRRRTEAPKAPVARLQEQDTRPSDSEDEHFLDDLALEMERELGDD